CGHPFDRDAQSFRNRSLRRGTPQLRAEDLDADLMRRKTGTARADRAGSGRAPDDPVRGVTSSLSGRRWLWRAGEERVSAGIAQRLDLPEIVSRLLAARGIGIDAAADFLEPTLRVLLPDPSAMIDMDLAADRLADAGAGGGVGGGFGDHGVGG